MLAFIILPSYYMERKSKDAALISTELKQWHRENTESLYYRGHGHILRMAVLLLLSQNY